MMWDRVIKVAVAAILSDDTLVEIYGTNVRMAGAGKRIQPVLEHSLITDGQGEQWAPCVLQFDQFCDTADQLRASNRALMRLFHRDVPGQLGGMTMWFEYVDGNILEVPDRDNTYARGVRFRFTPLREQYAPAPE